MQATAIYPAGVEDTLDVVSRLHAVRTDAEAGLFEAAAHFADLHAGEGLRRSGPVLAGMERAIQIGGAGTPLVAEFACAELGARMQMSTWSAKQYVADALDVRHRLPLIWARVVGREARVGNARLVATRTRHLSEEAAGVVDAAMAPFVDGSLPWGRFVSRLTGKVVAADPETAALREAERTREQFAKRTRSSEEGTAGFYVRSTVGVIARIEATVVFLAEALRAFGDGDVEDVRRVKAMVLLANPVKAVELLAAFSALRSRCLTGHLAPASESDTELESDTEPEPDLFLDAPADETAVAALHPEEPDALARMDAFARRIGFRPTHLPAWLTARTEDGGGRPTFGFDWSALLPPLTLYLHLSAEDLAAGEGGVVRWEGEGPVTHQFVHEHLRPLHRYDIRPVLDLAHQAPVDAYELPDRLRQAVHLRTPADTFPFSSNTSRRVDADHTLGYDPALARGPERHWSTRMGNLAPLGRFGHRIKTHGRWVLRQPFEGIYLWRDPHGQVFLVDATGTHQVTQSGRRAGAARSFDPDLEIYLHDTLVETDFDTAG